MKKVFEKVFISKVFVRKTTHRLHVHIFENNKKDGASDTELAKKEGSRKGLRQQSFLGRGGTAKRAHFRLLENNKKSRNKRCEA
ncbi:MAG TPA: hypothetical protein IAD23_06700 [Candidatus Scubalenecus merdavium]|uniref:Uncharacterized protein n=1 Tax=Candidatus Scybalenecus merdavium TaxID=2840939 RepID=A0A9D1MW30_9FIRM|nr:hypothetical protein [Candidatus Scubalenecus merdavium]